MKYASLLSKKWQSSTALVWQTPVLQITPGEKGENMITITGEPKEIAALVVALQERQSPKVKLVFDGTDLTDSHQDSRD